MLTPSQVYALKALKSNRNVFITGGAGTGKSHVLRQHVQNLSSQSFPILASTGAAAVLVGGRTFHSFFGLGIMEGGPLPTLDRAKRDKRLLKRLKKTVGVIIDEISMISGDALGVAERICRFARDSEAPWGGLQVVAVGDFAQLPPVSAGRDYDWSFLSPTWGLTDFLSVQLRTNLRCGDDLYCKWLECVRLGALPDDFRSFLNSKVVSDEEVPVEITRLFSRRDQTQRYNLMRLHENPRELMTFASEYFGSDSAVERLKKTSVLPDELHLKLGAKVMILQNDPRQRWVNGSLGKVADASDSVLMIELETGRMVELEKSSFHLLDPEGATLASVTNFPVQLAYAMTIHKSQGATMNALRVDLRRLWDPGQAYVALSRLRSADGLYLDGWDENSFHVSPQVRAFYAQMAELHALGEEEDVEAHEAQEQGGPSCGVEIEF